MEPIGQTGIAPNQKCCCQTQQKLQPCSSCLASSCKHDHRISGTLPLNIHHQENYVTRVGATDVAADLNCLQILNCEHSDYGSAARDFHVALLQINRFFMWHTV